MCRKKECPAFRLPYSIGCCQMGKSKLPVTPMIPGGASGSQGAFGSFGSPSGVPQECFKDPESPSGVLREFRESFRSPSGVLQESGESFRSSSGVRKVPRESRESRNLLLPPWVLPSSSFDKPDIFLQKWSNVPCRSGQKVSLTHF